MNRPLDRDVWQQHVGVGIELAFSFNGGLIALVARAAFKGFDAGVSFPSSPLSPNLGAWPRINEAYSLDDEKQIAYLAESAFDLSTRTIVELRAERINRFEVRVNINHNGRRSVYRISIILVCRGQSVWLR